MEANNVNLHENEELSPQRPAIIWYRELYVFPLEIPSFRRETRSMTIKT